MRYAQIRKMDISNGNNIGISLFVQGCHFHCKDCFNKETWDFHGGKEWTDDIRAKFIDLADKPYIRRISILGGEPFCEENITEVTRILSMLRQKYDTQKKLWVYTGYHIEDIPTATVLLCDVIVDGQYVNELKDFNYKWAGSTNQRVIDVQKTLLEGEIILYTGG